MFCQGLFVSVLMSDVGVCCSFHIMPSFGFGVPVIPASPNELGRDCGVWFISLLGRIHTECLELRLSLWDLSHCKAGDSHRYTVRGLEWKAIGKQLLKYRYFGPAGYF